MKAVITQRESTDQYGASIDMLEAAYTVYFEALDVNLYAVSNFTSDPTKHLIQADILILTGGGDLPAHYYANRILTKEQKHRDYVERRLIEYSLSHKIPILAICRGMQYINGIMGGKIVSLTDMSVRRAVRKDHPVLLSEENRVIYVNNYHNDGILIKDLADGLDLMATDTDNGTVEAFKSTDKKLLALQWHPERPYESSAHQADTDILIRAFINQYKSKELEQ